MTSDFVLLNIGYPNKELRIESKIKFKKHQDEMMKKIKSSPKEQFYDDPILRQAQQESDYDDDEEFDEIDTYEKVLAEDTSILTEIKRFTFVPEILNKHFIKRIGPEITLYEKGVKDVSIVRYVIEEGDMVFEAKLLAKHTVEEIFAKLK